MWYIAMYIPSTKYTSNYSDSHQNTGDIYYLSLHFFVAKPSQIMHFGLGGCDLGVEILF